MQQRGRGLLWGSAIIEIWIDVWNILNVLLNGCRAAGNGSKQTLCPHRPTHRERED